MALRYYRNGPARALAFPLVNGTDTAITVDSAAGFPIQFPYTIILDPDQSTEEVCDVTAAVGNVLTITRGVDSTTAVAHGAGAVVYHGVSARDPREANEHVNATTNVHGRTGSLVDTDSVQSIPGRKIFDDAESTGGGNFVDVGSVQTITGAKTFDVVPTTTPNGTVATLGGTQTFTGTKTFQNTVNNGTEDHNGAEDHSGTETHSGLLEFTNAAMRFTRSSSSTDDNTVGTAYTGGASAVGHSFTTPPSGMIKIYLTAYFGQTIDGCEAIVGFRLGTSATVGGGTETLGPSGDRSLVCGMAVNAGSPARLQATRFFPVTGLVPNAVYNVMVMFATTAGGNCQVFNREIVVDPVI